VGKQRVRDIGSEVHLQSIEPQDLADDEYEKEMQTVQRQATDERADTDRSCVPASAFGPHVVDHTPPPARGLAA